MKKLKVSLSALALLVGIGAAFATTSKRSNEDRRWGLNSSGQYIEVGSEDVYDCLPGGPVCTATYPTDVNPNDQENDGHSGIAEPTSIEPGTFLN